MDLIEYKECPNLLVVPTGFRLKTKHEKVVKGVVNKTSYATNDGNNEYYFKKSFRNWCQVDIIVLSELNKPLAIQELNAYYGCGYGQKTSFTHHIVDVQFITKQDGFQYYNLVLSKPFKANCILYTGRSYKATNRSCIKHYKKGAINNE